MFNKNLVFFGISALLLISMSFQAGIRCGNFGPGGASECLFYITKDFDINADNRKITYDSNRKNVFFVVTDLTSQNKIQTEVINVNELMDNIWTGKHDYNLRLCPYCHDVEKHGCWTQDMTVDPKITTHIYGVVFCKVGNHMSKGKLYTECPGSTTSLIQVNAGSSGEGTLFVPYVNECVDWAGNSKGYIQSMIKENSQGIPSPFRICKGQYSNYFSSDINGPTQSQFAKGPQGLVPLSNPNFYSGMKCDESSASKGVNVNFGGSNSSWPIGTKKELQRIQI